VNRALQLENDRVGYRADWGEWGTSLVRISVSKSLAVHLKVFTNLSKVNQLFEPSFLVRKCLTLSRITAKYALYLKP
jgi:hypothetical protein